MTDIDNMSQEQIEQWLDHKKLQNRKAAKEECERICREKYNITLASALTVPNGTCDHRPRRK